MPLAERARPTSFDQMVGNERIVGPEGVLRRMLENGNVRSCIFWGSPGCGKSCASRILASSAGLPYTYVNATVATTKDIRAVTDIATVETPQLLYLDEIQYLNKRQQQTLLAFVEDGSVVLIAATTENPYHDVYKALLSRCLVLEFQPVAPDAIEARLRTVLDEEGLADRIAPRTVSKCAHMAAGDVRRALNLVESVMDAYTDHPVTPEEAAAFLPTTNMGSFDADGEQHYRYKAALQKSIRGSDPDAAVFWLMQMLEGGDIVSPSRRMLVMASEDVGMADPMALPIVLACVQAAERVGLPEARYPLSQAAIYLATSPKSNSIGKAFSAAVRDIHDGYGTTVPSHIASEHPREYIYPHDFPHHWVRQQYLPNDLMMRHYYVAQANPQEQGRAKYWAKVKNGDSAPEGR